MASFQDAGFWGSYPVVSLRSNISYNLRSLRLQKGTLTLNFFDHVYRLLIHAAVNGASGFFPGTEAALQDADVSVAQGCHFFGGTL